MDNWFYFIWWPLLWFVLIGIAAHAELIHGWEEWTYGIHKRLNNV